MNRKLLWILIGAFLLFFVTALCLYWFFNLTAEADFLIRFVLSLGTISAVLFALYGDYLRAHLDPIELTMRVPEQSNTFLDFRELEGGREIRVYCHHIRVKNLTSHKPVENCRVWLKRVLVLEPNDKWSEPMKFAVPRLMVWAPFEY